jgi:hypothetical protein
MIPKLYELDTVNAGIQEVHRDALRAHQARLVAEKPAERLPLFTRTRPLAPMAALFLRIRHIKLLTPSRAT